MSTKVSTVSTKERLSHLLSRTISRDFLTMRARAVSHLFIALCKRIAVGIRWFGKEGR